MNNGSNMDPISSVNAPPTTSAVATLPRDVPETAPTENATAAPYSTNAPTQEPESYSYGRAPPCSIESHSHIISQGQPSSIVPDREGPPVAAPGVVGEAPAGHEDAPKQVSVNAKLLFHMAGPAVLASKAAGDTGARQPNIEKASAPASATPNPGSSGLNTGGAILVNAPKVKSSGKGEKGGGSVSTNGPQQPSLSWQCFSSLLFTGPGSKHTPEGTAGVQPMNLGPFSKASAVPLVLTAPYSASIREKLLRFSLESGDRAAEQTRREGGMDIDDSGVGGLTEAQRRRLVRMQRSVRARLVTAHIDKHHEECAAKKIDEEEKKRAQAVCKAEPSDGDAPAVASTAPTVKTEPEVKVEDQGGDPPQGKMKVIPQGEDPAPAAPAKEPYEEDKMDVVSNEPKEPAAAAFGGDAESKPVTRKAETEPATPAALTAEEKAKIRKSVAVNVHPVSGPITGLLPRWTTGTYRSRKQPKKDVRLYEKEAKRKTFEKEQANKIRNQLLLKDVMAHRDEFVRFHKARKVDMARVARSVRLHVESGDARREREEARAEERRLKALKENDMVAYNQLVQETKNERLKHLLNQTDGYIQTINKMIESQRADDHVNNINRPGAKPSLTSPGQGQMLSQDNDDPNKVGVVRERSSSIGGGEGSSSAQRYLESTHKLSEQVIQPSILKGGDLKEYQLAGLQWLVSLYNNNLNGILADEMGLGKTIQAIALLGYLMEYKHNHGPFLIVVPLSTLSNWSNEITKWVPDMMKVVYKGPPPLRRQLYKDEVEGGHFNILLTTYEYVMKDKSMLKKLPWEYIIVDEGHRMKNAQSKFAQILGNHYVSRHRILLTGTPLQNNLPELWALLNFLLPSIFNSVDTFDQWFNKPFSTFRQTQGPAEGGEDIVSLNQEERLLIVQRLHELLRPFMLRRVKDQVLDQLPEKTEIVLRCELSGWQRYLYRTVQQRCVSTIKGINTLVPMKGETPPPELTGIPSAISSVSLPVTDDGEDDEEAAGSKSVSFTAADEGGAMGGETSMTAAGAAGLNNVIMQLRKICNHPYLFMQDWPIDDDVVRTSGKFELLDRMLPKLKAAGHRVLMFSQMTQLMTILEKFFELKKFPYLRLDGSTVSDDREKRMYQFNDPNSPYFIFLLSTRAGGLGLNLATADTVFLFDSDWNPMMDAQAQDRAHRIGQKNAVRVFRLISTSPVEERILARATDKLNLTELVVEAGKFNKSGGGNTDTQARKEMVEALLAEYSESREQGVAEDAEAGIITSESVVQDEDQINDMMALHDSELVLYQKMDAEKAAERERLWALSAGGRANLPLPPRLMPADDLPQWIVDGQCWSGKYMKMFGPAVVEEVEVDTDQYDTTTSGRKRRLDAVGGSYSENMSDAQFDVFIGERKGRPSTGGTPGSTGRGRGRGGRVVSSRDPGSAPVTPVAKKPASAPGSGRGRGRGRGGGRGGSSGRTPAGGGAGGSGGGRGVRVRPGVIPMPLTSDLIRISLSLRKIERTDGSLLSFLFLDVPDAKLYPDYYQIIKNPISLKLITKKLRDAQYRTVSEITYDMELLVTNAKLYNGAAHVVAQDAEHILSEYKRLVGALTIPEQFLVPVDRTLPPLNPDKPEDSATNGDPDMETNMKADTEPDGGEEPNDSNGSSVDGLTSVVRGGSTNNLTVGPDSTDSNNGQENTDARLAPPVKRLKLSLSMSKISATEGTTSNQVSNLEGTNNEEKANGSGSLIIRKRPREEE